MESEKKVTFNGNNPFDTLDDVLFNENIPVEALCEILDQYWRSEIQSYRDGPTSSHILHQLVIIANWLFGNSSWEAVDYASSKGVIGEMGWRAAGIITKTPPPESTLPMPQEESGELWVYVGPASFLLKGRKHSITVIIGWDGPLTTFFAQVWDADEENTHYEQGKLVLWLGQSPREVTSVEALVEAIGPFVTLPWPITVKLAELQAKS